jgi:hypothetical protein
MENLAVIFRPENDQSRSKETEQSALMQSPFDLIFGHVVAVGDDPQTQAPLAHLTQGIEHTGKYDDTLNAVARGGPIHMPKRTPDVKKHNVYLI